MSDHAERPSCAEDATSMASSQAQQSCWMSRWINGSSKQGPVVDNSSLICYKGKHVDSGSCQMQTGLKMEDGLPNEKGVCNSDAIIHDLIAKPVDFGKRLSNFPFPDLSLEKNLDKASIIRTHGDHDLGHKPMSRLSGLQHGSPGKKNFQSFFLKKQTQNVPFSFRNVETMRISTMVDSVENLQGDPPKISRKAHHMLFTKEMCVNVSKGHHQVIGESTLARQEENTFGGSFSMSPGVASCSKGVKIQPLRTTDSEEKGTTGNPSIYKSSSGNEASAETDGMQILASRSGGVKIQPLFEEKEIIGNPSTCKSGSRHEASAETDGTRVETPKNQLILLGTESSPLTKCDTLDDSSPPTVCDSSKEKFISKRPINEIPDINEEVPGIQPAVSSTSGDEPSSSRVHSLNAKQLFSCDEQTSRSECKIFPERFGQDAGNRWIKRLKLNSSNSFGVGTKSSDVGEGSSHHSHGKLNMYFNRLMKGNGERYSVELQKCLGKEKMVIDQNVKSQKYGVPSSTGTKKRNRSTMLGCSWIQRWCESCTPFPTSNPQPLVICEPHSLKFGQEELAKKHFPSIAAMALMWKAMNGFPSGEFKKRGPVVVWDTKE